MDDRGGSNARKDGNGLAGCNDVVGNERRMREWSQGVSDVWCERGWVEGGKLSAWRVCVVREYGQVVGSR